MLDKLLGALALVLVLEGLMPLINPRGWRDMFSRALQMNDGQLRFVGLVAVGLGVVLWFMQL